MLIVGTVLGDFSYGQFCHIANHSAGQEAAGAENGQVKEQVRRGERQSGGSKLTDVVCKAAGTADADEGKAAGFLQSCHDGKA